MSKTCKILYRHPNKAVRDMPPKVLEWDDHKKERHYFEPQFVQGRVVYEVPEAYARVMLAHQPERYFLMEPRRIVVKRRKDGLSYQSIEVRSILETKRFKDFSFEAAEEEKARQEAKKWQDSEYDELDEAEREDAAAQERADADKKAKDDEAKAQAQAQAKAQVQAKAETKNKEPAKGNQAVQPAKAPQGAPQGSGAL